MKMNENKTIKEDQFMINSKNFVVSLNLQIE